MGRPAGLGRADHPEQGSLGESSDPEQCRGESGEDDLLIKSLHQICLFSCLQPIPRQTFNDSAHCASAQQNTKR